MVNPEFLDELGEAMGEVYAATADRIVINLARHFKRLKEGEKPGGAFEYQAQKLAEFGQINAETVQIIQSMMDGADQAVRDCLAAAIVDALDDVEPELKRAAEAGLLNGGRVPPQVSPRMMTAFQTYYAQSANKLNLVNTNMLESTANAYRATVSDIAARMRRTQSVLNTTTGQVVTGVESFNQALKLATDKLVENGITGFVDHAGHRWRPETYVAMDMRSTFHNTGRAAFWERNQDYANDLYLVSQHFGARPLCYPWQCKVISRQDRRRWEKDGEGKPVQVYAQSETSYGEPAGLFGVNCGHHPELFIPEVTKIPEVWQNDEQNAQTYAQSQQHRALERQLRAARLKFEVEKARDGDKDSLKAAREEVRKAADRLDEFCEETGRKRRQEREYAPVRASWPDPKTYGDSPTAVRDALRDYFKSGGSRGGALTDAAGGGTISPSTQADGDMIVKIGTLDVSKYERISTDITTADVVITDERIAHIRQRHPGDWEQYGKHIEATIIDPDYILRDSNPATAICIKRVIVDEEQKHLRTTLRLHTSNDEPNRQNSVLTFQKINKKEFGRLSRNQNVVYKRE